jgi:hypothetical protein
LGEKCNLFLRVTGFQLKFQILRSPCSQLRTYNIDNTDNID